MRKTAFLYITLTLAMIIFVSTSFGSKAVGANPDYNIDRVNHTVSVLYNGYVVINDTITTSGQMPNNFLLGFPYKYGPDVLRCLAYNADDRSKTFPVTLDVTLEDRAGFYCVEVDFSKGAPQTFSVEIVLSNVLLTQEVENASVFNLDFPVFPSLTKTTTVCNGSIVLPEGAQYLNGPVDGLNYSQQNLGAFAYNASVVTFSLPEDSIELFEITQLNRQITINEFGEIQSSDTYYITNRSPNTISLVDIVLPSNASNPQAEDQFGRAMPEPEQISLLSNRYEINLTLPVESGKSTIFTISYSLMNEAYFKSPQGANNLAFDMTVFQDINYYVDQASVVFVLPEGARLLSFEDTLNDNSFGISRSVFQETVTVNKKSVTSLDSFAVGVAYEYNPVWLAFRPTMWVWALAIVGSVVVFVWQRTKAPTGAALPAKISTMRPEYIRSFVDSYEEKMKLIFEVDSLEARVQKGRIPRRRYKVQKKTLEMRLNTLSRSLGEVKERMRSAGGHYADLMRQLEVAETEINEAEANVRSIEARYGRGEISLETYRKLLGDYQRRKEKAETTINGILLRLREEIR